MGTLQTSNIARYRDYYEDLSHYVISHRYTADNQYYLVQRLLKGPLSLSD